MLRENLKFSGKTLKEWAIELSVEFPDDITFMDIQQLSNEIDRCFSVAHNNYIVAQGVYSFLKRSLEIDTINAHIDLDNEGPGPRRTIVDKDRIVAARVKDSADKVIIAEFISEFWKEQVKLLDRRQKTLEQIHWALKTEKEIK